jgi:hypothetical protein
MGDAIRESVDHQGGLALHPASQDRAADASGVAFAT